jgi:cytochrome c
MSVSLTNRAMTARSAVIRSQHALSRIALSLALAAAAALPMRASAQTSCPDPKPTDFKKEALVPPGTLKEPIEMSVVKDGRVFVVERAGNIFLYDSATHNAGLALKLDTYINPGAYDVGGILGVAASPDFPTGDWVYVYYAPKASFNGQATKENGKLTYRLARFRFAGGVLDSNTEQVLFEIPAIWETHNGGSLKFGKGGDLYLSTGDNHNPGCSEQYSAMDERAGRSWCDDQGSTANTNDLRGKVLRIHPEAAQVGGKWYSIPKGNLKERYASVWPTAELAAKVRPEIYTMGHRNPYRLFPDPVTGRLYIGEFGPAAAAASDRGPEGADQIKIVDSASYLGYPYFLKDNQPYCHWDYGQVKCVAIQGQTGLKFDPLKPINNSPNNTGVNILPPVTPAALWEHDGNSPDPVPGLKSCGLNAGPVYHYDASSTSKLKFPPWFEGKWTFFGIGGGGWTAKITTVPPGPIHTITKADNPPWYNASSLNFSATVHDMEYGSDGALYVTDYGAGFYNNNGDAGLYRVTYTGPIDNSCFVSGVAQRGNALPERAKTLLSPADGRDLDAPAGSAGLEAYDAGGRRVWERHWGNAAPGRLELPASIRGGLLRIRWL